MSLDSHEEVRYFCGSRRDQEEGGEPDSHQEVRLSITGPGEIKREGGEPDSHQEVRLSITGPGEIKRRAVSRTLTKELDCQLRVQARSRGGR